MDKEYWHQKWQSKQIGFNQSQPNKLLQCYFSTLKLTPGCRVFVPLCGQSIDMLWLADQGYHVVGIELSRIACDAFFKDNKIPFNTTEINDFTVYKSEKITLFCGDFFKLDQETLGQIDAVYDRAALIALPFKTRTFYAKHLIELMLPATTMLLITTAYNQSEMPGPPFSVDNKEVALLYSDDFNINRLYGKPIYEIPQHLKIKGLAQATEQAYLLTRKI